MNWLINGTIYPSQKAAAQALGVQQHAVDAEHSEIAVVAAVAVAGVADQVMRKMLEVSTDLAEAAGHRLGAQQCVARGRKTR